MKHLKLFEELEFSQNEDSSIPTEMTKLEELNKEFKKYRDWGYNQYESAERAVNEVFAGINVKPHIYQDKYEDASHVFFENQVLFFNGDIYIK
jgi:cell fate (sporulation/competence/biofilm development) regulator YmcA (YheA/YmcA/DUF963 family)